MRALPLTLAAAVVIALAAAIAIQPGNTPASGEGEMAGVRKLAIEPPAGVKRSGGSRLAEFRLGRRVAAESGCLACHRIGDEGHRGPGENLTHAGSQLDAAALRRAILHPKAPMPSFRGLPKAKLNGLVEFLSLLH